MQALTRTGTVLRSRPDTRRARAALRAFDRRAPFGVSTRAPGGSHFVMYSTEPSLRILNGHLRALTGLRDLASLAESGEALRLYRRGERAARVELREADTGAWSRYSDGGREASLGYHRLVTGFLADLCERDAGRRYCSAARRFRRYEREPTRVTVRVPSRPRARDATGVAVWISKVSAVSVTVRDARGRVVLSRRTTLPRGRHRIAWTPARRGRYTVRAAATGPGSPPVGRGARTVRVLRSRAEIARAVERRRAAARRRALARRRAAVRRAQEQRRAADDRRAARQRRAALRAGR
ncbi:D-glucuronyl C5-epimerase family protein [Conexibacter sp. W3-3-2]|uniref:D-glucuronyl C5-epimerase family protein n=1 Tax=Conexibacter sp. W3-3-2 TaxID=2675227 RepID=UPI002815ED3A|nr:D-glucuronyl C5-epimerase family protein [Conexibacter sp. W3-3-2]